MFIKMKESKGFTLVELMIVVAIIGILAAVAVPFYQKYIQKSRLTSKVWPGMHAIETNIGTYYSFQQTLTLGAGNFSEFLEDASTHCFDATWIAANPSLRITIASGKCTELSALAGRTLWAAPRSTDGKIIGWELGGPLAIQLGLEGEM